jgi:N-acetylglucosamine-6-phosphate deacetylase
MSGAVVVHDAVLIDAEGRRPGWIRVEGGAIVGVGEGAGRPDGAAGGGTGRPDAEVDGGRGRPGEAGDGPSTSTDRVIDAGGRVVAPGFIDLHGHGAAGVSYDDDGDLSAALAHHRRHGTTRQVLSLVSAPPDRHEDALGRIAAFAATDPLVLGSHLEGPFLAASRKGAHDESALTTPTAEAVARLLRAADGSLRMVTLAPELDGAADAMERFADNGVVVAVGHTTADYDVAFDAFARGARALTHAFNAMPPLLHRDPGPVLAAVDAGAVLELIVDGVHVHPSVWRAVFALAPGRVALVTDSMSATGCADGSYRLGGLDVVVAAGEARLADSGALAGSVLTQDVALRLAVESGVDPVAAITALTRTPADLLGRGDLGRLEVGARGDLVVLGDDWSPDVVVAEGAVLFERG